MIVTVYLSWVVSSIPSLLKSSAHTAVYVASSVTFVAIVGFHDLKIYKSSWVKLHAKLGVSES